MNNYKYTNPMTQKSGKGLFRLNCDGKSNKEFKS